jgi:3-dehydroquinate synthase
VAIVQKDEFEAGERRKLNLGHTFAHAMEKLQRTFSHGEAVAAGIVLIANAGLRQGKLSEKDAGRISNVIGRMGLPIEFPVETRKLLGAVKYDKKREKETINLVYPVSIGRCEIERFDLNELEKLFL